MQDRFLVVDLDDNPGDGSATVPPGCVVAVTTDPAIALAGPAARRIDTATFTITESACSDPRVIRVDSVRDVLAELRSRVAERPLAATVCDDVLRAGDGNIRRGLVLESLAYSTLQAGPEFARWRDRPGRRRTTATGTGFVRMHRSGSHLAIELDRPDRHNAFGDAMRGGLLEGLALARADDTITEVTLSGRGPSFCSGGDLAEFGSSTDPASAHLARTKYSPALELGALRDRLGTDLTVRVHGSTLGSGLEMASFGGTVVAHPATQFGLPELDLGLIPGAGGTVGVPRRIGRWRTAFLVLTGRRIDARTALEWGLVDRVDGA